ncbi:MAG TPA: hypothetical protein VLW26_08500 [Steroidobacteraceae bacterium]|nr:hypothetical protein [Steroidobacteraceae bacterium]
MSEPSQEPAPGPSASTWEAIKSRKVVQWSLAYVALAYTLLHGVELLGHAFEWPVMVDRVVTVVLIAGLPVAALIAWYHGDRAQQRVSGMEIALLTVLLAVGGSVLWMLARSAGHATASEAKPAAANPAAVTQQSAVAQASARAAAAAAIPPASIAVVPFANLTGEPSKEYFSDGMAEELINSLANVPGLKVASRISSFAYKGRNTDIREIARQLGVATILEGSVRSAGERVRVTVQLINADTGFHVWSQSYDHKYADLFKLQDDLASEIVSALRANIHTDLPQYAGQRPPTQNLQAYDLFLRAMSGANGAGPDLPAMEKLRALLQQATTLDPGFALAWAWNSIFGAFEGRTAAEIEPNVRHALELDPSLTIAHEGLALVSVMRRDWVQADLEFRTALTAANPVYPVRPNYAAFVLAPVGHMHEALHEALEGQRAAPAFAPFAGIVATLNSELGRDAEAIRFDQKATELGALSYAGVRSAAAARAGRTTEAADLAVQELPAPMRDRDGAQVIRDVYAARADPARRVTAVRELAGLMDKVKNDASAKAAPFADPFQFARFSALGWYTELGALDSAYALADQIVSDVPDSKASIFERANWAALWTPEMRAFRQDPRFQGLATRLGLMEYWQQNGPPDECDVAGGKLICR